jgi:hypothetical protein
MTRPIIRIHDTETDEVIDREMNDEEFAQWEIDVQVDKDRIAAIEKSTADKEAVQIKLAALGLTTEDLKALGL